MKSIKRMVLMGAAAMVIMSFAAPAMADEVQDHRDDPPVKNPGISTCDITPSVCESPTDPVADPGHDPVKNPGISTYDITPSGCQNTDDSLDDHGHNSGADPDTNDPSPVDEEPFKDPGIRQCDITPPGCQNTDDPLDDHGHNSGADPDANDPNLVEEEPNKEEEEASVPGAVKAGEVSGRTTTTAQENDASAQKPVSASDEAGQIANSGTIYGCPYDYEYDEEYDTCLPTSESFGFWPVIMGEKPWPDSPGGYVGLLGAFGEDGLEAVGVGIQIGLGHYIGDTLVDFGEGGGPIGWGIQGLGYTLGFTGDAAGVLVEGAGEIVGAVSDGVGEVIDGIGNAAEDAWDEVTSWF